MTIKLSGFLNDNFHSFTTMATLNHNVVVVQRYFILVIIIRQDFQKYSAIMLFMLEFRR